MAEKIATRAAYGKALVELADQEPNLVVLDADLSGSTMTKEFAAAHPDRFFDMGIAEANMVGVAAGLATCGKKPFVNSFAMFAAGRAWEQVRNSVAYPGLNVKVVGSHGGLSVGEDGATHQCIEDLAIMRAIPNMTVLCPCDGYEMREAVRALLAYEGPAYMRLGRLAVETVTDRVEGYQFAIGKGALLRDGQDVTVVAVGMMVQMALQAAEQLAGEGISVRVIDMHTLKPLDTESGEVGIQLYYPRKLSGEEREMENALNTMITKNSMSPRAVTLKAMKEPLRPIDVFGRLTREKEIVDVRI